MSASSSMSNGQSILLSRLLKVTAFAQRGVQARFFAGGRGSCSRFWRDVGSLFSGFSWRWTQFAPCGHKLGQADDVVGGHGEDESGADLVEATHLTCWDLRYGPVSQPA